MESKALLIKQQIKKQFKSIRQFSIAVNIPYSTITVALDKGDRGIDTMAYGTVITICKKLGIDPIDFLPQNQNNGMLLPQEKRLVLYYSELNGKGKSRIFEQIEDMRELEKYRENSK